MKLRDWTFKGVLPLTLLLYVFKTVLAASFLRGDYSGEYGFYKELGCGVLPVYYVRSTWWFYSNICGIKRILLPAFVLLNNNKVGFAALSLRLRMLRNTETGLTISQ